MGHRDDPLMEHQGVGIRHVIERLKIPWPKRIGNWCRLRDSNPRPPDYKETSHQTQRLLQIADYEPRGLVDERLNGFVVREDVRMV
jgi:hypothetical protein